MIRGGAFNYELALDHQEGNSYILRAIEEPVPDFMRDGACEEVENFKMRLQVTSRHNGRHVSDQEKNIITFMLENRLEKIMRPIENDEGAEQCG